MNVLVALAWPNHVHHERAHEWFASAAKAHRAWATCPATQSGFVRVSSNPRLVADARTPLEAIRLLGRIVALPGHAFWSDDIAIVSSPHVARDRLVGYRQVTDAHLLALAVARGGTLVTFDGGIADIVPDGRGSAIHVLTG